MAARTSTISGAWADSATWGGSAAPGSGDTATIATGTNVTVEADTTVGAGGTAAVCVTIQDGATLTINSGYELTVKGHIQIQDDTVDASTDDRLILAAGATLTLDVPTGEVYFLYLCTANWQAGRLTCNGTAGSRCTVRRTGLGTAKLTTGGDGTNYGGALLATYTDFTDLGSATIPAALLYLPDWPPHKLELSDCVFSGGGELRTVNYLGAACTVSLIRCRWTGTLADRSLHLTSYSAPTGARDITNCSFDNYVYLYPATGLNLVGSYFSQAVQYTNSTVASMTGNFFRATGGDLFGNQFCDSINNYWLQDTTSSPHYVQFGALGVNALIDGDIFELTGTTETGDCIMLGQPGSATTVTVRRCLKLPNSAGTSSGTMISALGNTNITFSIEHCTIHGGGGTDSSGVRIGETQASFAGQVTSCKANLYWDTTAQGFILCDISASPAADAVAAADCDYNGTWNAETGSSGVGYDGLAFSTGTPGANDVTGDPTFVDSSRSLATWGTANGTDGSVAAALALLAADPTRIADLIGWVKAGFQPQNAVYSGATYPGDALTLDAAGNALGGTIGALAYLPAVAPALTTGPLLPEGQLTMLRNTAGQKLTVFAYEISAGLFTGKAGDAANITCLLAQDYTTAVALTDTNPTEVGAGDMPGYYRFDLTQAETDAGILEFFPASTTAGVRVVALPAKCATLTPVDSLPTYLTAAGLDSVTIDGLNARQALAVLLAAEAGQLALVDTTVTIRDIADTADRIVATVDPAGNRSAVAITPPT